MPEAFLPSEVRRLRGVYFTPPELASFIVRSADLLAQKAFDRGLAGCRVIEPALGDGVFARAVLAAAPGAKILAYEILPEVAAEAARTLPESVEIRTESALDAFPALAPGEVPVVLGNPPWRGHTANPGTIAGLLADYYRFVLRPERNTKWLHDDYVRFFRWAQEVVDRAGRGIVGFVTNHAWLRGPTHRAMRASLAATFDREYLLDLHGSLLRREVPPEGGRDENVFPVRPGCAVALLVKTGASCVVPAGVSPASGIVRHDLRGGKAEKLAWLASHDVATTPWETWQPDPADPEYDSWPSLADLFGLYSVGMVSGRDVAAYFATREALLAAHPDLPPDEAFEAFYRPGDMRWTAFRLHTRPRRRVMRHLLVPGARALIALRQGGPGVRLRHLVADRPVDNCVLSTESTARAYAFPLRLIGGIPNLDPAPLGLSSAEDAFDHIVRVLSDPAYQAKYRSALQGDFPRIPPGGDWPT